jgi:hypothetical protein
VKTVAQDTVIRDGYDNITANLGGLSSYESRYTFGIQGKAGGIWIGGGDSSLNTMAFSKDGQQWYGLGVDVFSSRCNHVLYNGSIWVATGVHLNSSGNTLAYSVDGLKWTGLGKAIFANEATDVAWNGIMFVAGGLDASNALAYSYNGIQWTGLGVSMFGVTGGNRANVYSIGWNGQQWLAGGSTVNASTLLCTSVDGIVWTALAYVDNFRYVYSILWTGTVWAVGGIDNSGGSALAITNSLVGGGTWSKVASTITTSIQGLASNGQLLVAIGNTSASGVGNTLAYSSDTYANTWFGLGTTVFNDFSGVNHANSGISSVVWNGSRFVAFGGDLGGNCIATSRNGLVWNASSSAKTVFTGGRTSGGNYSLIPGLNSFIFPSNALMVGNRYSYDNGNSWSNYVPDLSSSSVSAIGWNGERYFLGGSGVASRLSVNSQLNNPQWISLSYAWNGVDPSAVLAVAYGNGQWIAGGGPSSTGKALQQSSDGINWLPLTGGVFTSVGATVTGVGYAYELNTLVNGNGYGLWVISGTVGGVPFIYSSSDGGSTWTLGTGATGYGGGVVSWNTNLFIIGHGATDGAYATSCLSSTDGYLWTRLALGAYGAVSGIANNAQNIWVVSTNGGASSNSSILVSYDNTGSWTAVKSQNSYLYTNVLWTGLGFYVNTGGNGIELSYDGTVWNYVQPFGNGNNGRGVLWNDSSRGLARIQQATLVGGDGSGCCMLYSQDGVIYKSVGGLDIFTVVREIAWNGTMYVAAGSGANTLAYSYNGLNWVGLGTGVFSVSGNGVVWNGKVWLALGSGGNTMATSVDGLVWTGLGTGVFGSVGYTAKWNGQYWLAGGGGGIAYTADVYAGSWTLIGAVSGITTCLTVEWMSGRWYIGGSGGSGTRMAYLDSLNPSVGSWVASSLGFSVAANSIAWNGTVAVAVGQGGATNSILVSSNRGTTWTGLGLQGLNNGGYNVGWNGIRWVIAGASSTLGGCVLYSENGTNWYAAIGTSGLSNGYAVGVNSRVGAVVVADSIVVPEGDSLLIRGPPVYDFDGLNSASSIRFPLEKI